MIIPDGIYSFVSLEVVVVKYLSGHLMDTLISIRLPH